MHIGGAHPFPFGNVKFTIAHHGSITPEGQYVGIAAGVLLTVDGITIYHTGDTGLFMDMQLIGELNPVDVMLLPIGDNYTMGIKDAAKAVEFVKPKLAVPMHYNTFPLINSDPDEFVRLTEAKGFKAKILSFGEEIVF
jgi:L-ascorbate metabolism protein UlaG (beta-lactamase superfamily)